MSSQTRAATHLAILLAAVLTGLGASPRAWAEPATTFKILDKSTFKPPLAADWFARADVNLDLPARGAAGFGISFGHLWKYTFLDFSTMLYTAKYGALRVYQPGIDSKGSPLNPNQEIARPRGDAENSTIFSIGPGIGSMFNFFGSEKWVQIGRFGINYVQYLDTTNSLSFRGGLANFHGELGYKLGGAFMLAPGVTYNVGYLSRSDTSTLSDPHNGFMPIQWWAMQLGLYVWL